MTLLAATFETLGALELGDGVEGEAFEADDAVVGGGNLSLAMIPTLSSVARKYWVTLGMLMYFDSSVW